MMSTTITIGKATYHPESIVDLKIVGKTVIAQMDFGGFDGKLGLTYEFENDSDAKNTYDKLQAEIAKVKKQ
jgi:hypothetical protein